MVESLILVVCFGLALWYVGKPLFPMIFFLLIFTAGSPPVMDEIFAGVERGILRGRVFELKEGKKRPIPNQEIAIMVFHQGEEILALHKPTDDKGEFEFKNIFKDPSFEFVLGTFYQNVPYVMEGLKIKNGEDSLTVDFELGPGSPFAIREDLRDDLGMPPASSTVAAGFTATEKLRAPYQQIALALSLIVVGLASYFGFKKYDASGSS